MKRLTNEQIAAKVVSELGHYPEKFLEWTEFLKGLIDEYVEDIRENIHGDKMIPLLELERYGISDHSESQKLMALLNGWLETWVYQRGYQAGMEIKRDET